MSGGFGFDGRFGISLHLGGDVDWFVLVASSMLSSSLEHDGRQMLGSNNRGLPDPEHSGKDQRWVYVHRRTTTMKVSIAQWTG
jgi:hypothetical protein